MTRSVCRDVQPQRMLRVLPFRAMPGLIECVPNVSEGRRPDIVDRLVAAVRAVEGVRLLDRTSDADHNRSVITFAGPPDPVEAAAHALVDAAIRERSEEHTSELQS